MYRIQTEEELQALLGYPSELVQRKVINHIDHHCRDFIAKSPFLVMSTASREGDCDTSPRGDAPGFVYILDDKRMIIPERPGNKRMDSLRNILSNPHVGLLFLIPGLGETLRVNGKATLVQDEVLLEKMAVKGKWPIVGICVEVQECFIHCAKAFKRSRLWERESWPTEVPTAAKILADHAKLPGASEEAISARLSKGYREQLY
ncbi:pyridoxamine 5'-phosphate oxidase family protein [Bacillus spongiae]|uniref:Pyridoxamine 5'-phosphate oxidase family protein n=1 Tax=Bacillus spongiae TaxID=2683610 RepID=A0ABU8HAK0_9BACI